VAPKRSTLAYANEHRPWELYQTVFEQTLSQRQELVRSQGGRKKFRFKNKLMSLDGSIIDLSVSMFDWAKFRRPDEVLGLRREDIDLERGQLHIRNGKSPAARRTLDLTSESRQILSRRREGKSPWIFPSQRTPGKRLTRLNGAHDRLCARAVEKGVSLKFVLYKHTFATRMAQAGVDLLTLAAILGHSSIRIVQRYVHPTADHKRAAMERYDESLRAGRGGKEAELNVKILGNVCPPLRSKMPYFPPSEPIREGRLNRSQLDQIQLTTRKDWRRGSESNRRIKVLQTLR